MFESYATEQVEFRRRAGINDCGEAVWEPCTDEPPIMVRAVVDVRKSLRRSKYGEVMSVDGTIIVSEKVECGDAFELDGCLWPVTQVEVVRGLDGEVLHYEAVLGSAGRGGNRQGLNISPMNGV